MSLVFDEIIVVGDMPELRDLAWEWGFVVACDIFSGAGVLGGIHAGLVVSRTFYSFVVGCDMPFLSVELMRYMRDIVDADQGTGPVEPRSGFHKICMSSLRRHDIVIPQVGSFIEPLHAVYARNCITPIEETISRGELRVASILSKVYTLYLKGEVIRRFDPDGLSFFNVNTGEDLARAAELVGENGLREMGGDEGLLGVGPLSPLRALNAQKPLPPLRALNDQI